MGSTSENGTAGLADDNFNLLNSPAWRAAGLGFLLCACWLGLAGNGLVLALLACHRRLQNGINACVANIAVCDLLVCGIILPMSFAQREAGAQLVGDAVCLLSGCALFICTSVANSSFALIGVNRFVFLMHPAAYRRCLEGPRHVIIRLAANWLSWLALSGGVFARRAFQYLPDSFLCFFSDTDTDPATTALVMLAMVTLPSIVAGFCYCRILSHILASRRRVRDLQSSDRQAGEQRRLTRSLAVVMLNYLIFNLLWLPYSCYAMFGRLLRLATHAEHNVLLWTALFGCSVKPLLQLTLSPEFRGQLRQLRLKKCSRRQGAATPSSPIAAIATN